MDGVDEIRLEELPTSGDAASTPYLLPLAGALGWPHVRRAPRGSGLRRRRTRPSTRRSSALAAVETFLDPLSVCAYAVWDGLHGPSGTYGPVETCRVAGIRGPLTRCRGRSRGC